MLIMEGSGKFSQNNFLCPIDDVMILLSANVVTLDMSQTVTDH